MKKTNFIKTKRTLTIIMTALTVMGLLAGCGNAKTEEVVDDVQVVEAVEETQEEAVVEDEGTITPPFIAGLEKYDSIISGLSADQYYAFAAVGEDQDVLLVTDYTYEDEGMNKAIDATMYYADDAGNVIEMGQFSSEGTAYPLAVYDDAYLMFGGNHHMAMVFVKDGNVITKKDASEVFDEDANVKYYLFDYDNEFEGEVEDNSELTKMYEAYSEAVVISFNKVE